jgi:hypothetical protein
MSLPADARRRWQMTGGGTVEIADLGDFLLVAPARNGGLRQLLRDAIADAGGYEKVAGAITASEPDLS